MGRSFSTQDIRAQDGFDYWNEIVENTYTYASSSINKNLTKGEFDLSQNNRQHFPLKIT